VKIPFNKPYLTGKEIEYIKEAVEVNGQISGNGLFTQKCQTFFEERYGFKKCLLTTSCTDALEMCAILLNIQPRDEVIMPSYNFVSAANAFVLRGAKIVFADSYPHHPNIDPSGLEALITNKTKAIVVVHYAGIACDMDAIGDIANNHQLFVIEDAAHSIDSFYREKPLGSVGNLATFSFHETKNIVSGEGGMLVVNDERFVKRAEIIWEKGTNRSAFFRGEVDKYNWMDIGSSFLPSEIIAAFLWAQLENLDDIQKKRKQHWDTYYNGLKEMGAAGHFSFPTFPEYATNNAHMYYLIMPSIATRSKLIKKLREVGVHAVFHYLTLHNSPFYVSKHDGRQLPNSDKFADCLVRLPLYYALEEEEINYITYEIENTQ